MHVKGEADCLPGLERGVAASCKSSDMLLCVDVRVWKCLAGLYMCCC